MCKQAFDLPSIWDIHMRPVMTDPTNSQCVALKRHNARDHLRRSGWSYARRLSLRFWFEMAVLLNKQGVSGILPVKNIYPFWKSCLSPKSRNPISPIHPKALNLVAMLRLAALLTTRKYESLQHVNVVQGKVP
jgi:hypothetical protein